MLIRILILYLNILRVPLSTHCQRSTQQHRLLLASNKELLCQWIVNGNAARSRKISCTCTKSIVSMHWITDNHYVSYSYVVIILISFFFLLNKDGLIKTSENLCSIQTRSYLRYTVCTGKIYQEIIVWIDTGLDHHLIRETLPISHKSNFVSWVVQTDCS